MATTSCEQDKGPPGRVAVMGAGLIGLWVGGLLASHVGVTLIGRPLLHRELAHGLRLTDMAGLDRQVPAARLAVATDPSAVAGAGLVLLCVKSRDTAAAADAMAPHLSPGTLLVSLQNGVANVPQLRERLPDVTVLAGMVPFNVARRAPAHLHRGTPGSLMIEAHPAIDVWQPLFARAGLPLETQDDMARVQWGKLLVNLNNAINALSGLSLSVQLRQRAYRIAWAMALDEGLRLVARAGIRPIDPLPMPLRLMPQILRLPDALYHYVVSAGSGGRVRVDPHARSSMADDLAAGRPTEIDALQGEIVRLADRLGRSAPVNARLIGLVREAEAGAPPLDGPTLLARLRAAARP